jgi:predicted AlkP superfamily phosphohydrolase/phosphomutase
MSDTKKVIVILLDAAEPSLVEKWMDDGSLPNLKWLREKGIYGRLASVAQWLPESMPYSFYTGQHPASHGAYGYVIFEKETMKLRPPGPDWLPMRPFWRNFPENGPRTIVLDVSNAYPPEAFNGSEITGWATHWYSLAPFQTYPPELANWIHKRHGSSLLPDEIYGLESKRDFIKSRDLMIEISGKFKDLCVELMQKESWGLFMAFLYTVHHSGHRMWNTDNIKEPLGNAEKVELGDSLRQVYIAADRAIGGVVQAADPDSIFMVISLHGMGINRSRTWVFPEMLRRVLDEKENNRSPLNLLKRIRLSIPVDWRHQIKSRLPYYARRWLTRFWRVHGHNWKQIRAFNLFSDTHGWVRINLKGREAQGTVEPYEYESFCQKISDGLKTFVDADTGEPVVKSIVASRRIFKGKKVEDLPDLIVEWADSPAALHRALVSPQFGTIPWPTPGRNPEGRSGNHCEQGFLIASGTGIKSGNINDAHILDLAPTILTLLGQPVPPEMEGKVLPIMKK